MRGVRGWLFAHVPEYLAETLGDLLATGLQEVAVMREPV